MCKNHLIMPQVFQVLRCFKCLVFQVHQTKKSNKFSCKMCGEKQSLKRHYGLGTGQECRLQVQKLNGLRGELDELNESLQSNNESEEEELSEATVPPKRTTFKDRSKWSNFIEDDNEINDPEPIEPMYLGNAEVVLEVPKRNKRFVKPKPAIKSNVLQNDNQAGSRKPWPARNEITKTTQPCHGENKTAKIYTYPCYDKNETVKTIPVQNSQNENVTNFKHKLSEENIIKDFPKPKIKKVFEPMKINKQSKWAQFTENTDDNDDSKNKNYEDDEIKHDICLSTYNKINVTTHKEQNSQEIEEIPKSPTKLDKKIGSDVKTNIFTSYDESELDSILDV